MEVLDKLFRTEFTITGMKLVSRTNRKDSSCGCVIAMPVTMQSGNELQPFSASPVESN